MVACGGSLKFHQLVRLIKFWQYLKNFCSTKEDDWDKAFLEDCDDLSCHELAFIYYLCACLGMGVVEARFATAERARQTCQCEKASVLQCWWRRCVRRHRPCSRFDAALRIRVNWKA